MIKELRELNNEFFRMSGDLTENTELLSPELHSYMEKVICENYKLEYLLLKKECEIDEASRDFKISLKQSELIPRLKFRLFRRRKPNAAAELIAREVDAEVEELFATRLSVLTQHDYEVVEGEPEEPAEPEVQTNSAEQNAEEKQAVAQRLISLLKVIGQQKTEAEAAEIEEKEEVQTEEVDEVEYWDEEELEESDE